MTPPVHPHDHHRMSDDGCPHFPYENDDVPPVIEDEQQTILDQLTERRDLLESPDFLDYPGFDLGDPIA